MSCRIKFPERTAGDNYTPLEVHFLDESGFAISLSGVDHVQILARDISTPNGEYFIDEEMIIADATNGIAQYQMSDSESATVGTYELKFWIWHTDTTREPFPQQETVMMKIEGF